MSRPSRRSATDALNLQFFVVLFGIYMVVNGLERFLIEKIRVNTTYKIFGAEITQAEIISFGLIVAGLTIIYKLSFKNKSIPKD